MDRHAQPGRVSSARRPRHPPRRARRPAERSGCSRSIRTRRAMSGSARTDQAWYSCETAACARCQSPMGCPTTTSPTNLRGHIGHAQIGTARGLARLHAGAVTTYTTAQGLPTECHRGITEDHEGGVWVSTPAGAARFAGGRSPHGRPGQGLSSNNVYAIYADRAGNLWVATLGGGVNRLRNGVVTRVDTRNGLTDDDVVALFEDRAGACGSARGAAV